MQPLTQSPRNLLSEAQVVSLLQTMPVVQITYGADLLDMYRNMVEDITQYMVEGSTISRNNYNTIHGTCSLMIASDAPINIENQCVRPWMELSGEGISAKFYLGVYVLSSPQLDNSTLPSILTYTGYDLLFFLNQPVGDSVNFVAGTNPVDNAITLVGDALPQNPTVNYTPTAKTLAADTSYPFDSSNKFTYLDIINAQLALCGYMGVWADWLGVFQMQPYVTPSERPFEYAFDLTSDTNIVAEARTSSQDIFDVPNWFRFVQNGITVPPAEGINQYTYIDTSNRKSSYPSRGYYVKSINFIDAADYTSLVANATIAIDAALAPVETFDVSTSPFPLAWHFDQILMRDPNLAVPLRRVQAQSWQITLDGTSDMSWVWETV